MSQNQVLGHHWLPKLPSCAHTRSLATLNFLGSSRAEVDSGESENTAAPNEFEEMVTVI